MQQVIDDPTLSRHVNRANEHHVSQREGNVGLKEGRIPYVVIPENEV